MSKPASHPLRCHPSNQQWYRSLAIIFRDNRPLLVRSLLNSGKIVEGRFENEPVKSDFQINNPQDKENISRCSSTTSKSTHESNQPLSINRLESTSTISNHTQISASINNSKINSCSEINYLDWTIFTSLDSIDLQLNNVDNDIPNKEDNNNKQNSNQNSNQSSNHRNFNKKPTNSNYIGVLQPSDTHKIHGYVTASRIKFILLLDSSKPMPRDVDIKNFFENLHQSWMKLTANPFYKPGKIIKNMPKFVKMVDGLILKL